MPRAARTFRPIALLAVALAYAVPGAGHVCIGRPVRGLILFLTITVTFWSGVAVGGVMTLDRRNERWWFTAQMLNGVSGFIGWRQYEKTHDRLAAKLAEDRRYQGQMAATRREPRLGSPAAVHRVFMDGILAEEGLALAPPADTVARAYTGVAGMLNLLCIFDVLVLSLMGVSGEGPVPGQRQPKGRYALTPPERPAGTKGSKP